MSLTHQILDAPDASLRRLLRWIRKTDNLRGALIEMVPRDVLEEEVRWAVDPHEFDGGMCRT